MVNASKLVDSHASRGWIWYAYDQADGVAIATKPD